MRLKQNVISSCSVVTMCIVAGTWPINAKNQQSIVEPPDQNATSPSHKGEDLRSEVAARLEADRKVASYEVDVIVTNGAAVLSGKVDNLLAKERAEQLAGTVRGIRQVRNEIIVARPNPPDWEIQTDVQAALRREPALKSYLLETEIDQGNVTLTGIVSSEHRKALGEALVKSVPGVAAVENEIRVEAGLPRPDEEIRQDVLSRIEWDPHLHNPQVHVNVKAGSVVIDGSVRTAAAKDRLYQDALVTGVREVNLSGVRVSPERQNPDSGSELLPTGR